MVKCSSKNVKELVNILKEIDSNIDLARDRFQIDILINATIDKYFSISEFSELFGVNRKSLADAVQKMKNKGLVEKLGRDKYKLTEKGVRIRKILSELASSRVFSQDIYDLFHFLQIILILGTIDREWVSISTLAKYLDIDQGVIEKIVKKYSDEKIIKVREGILGIEVALTFEGRNLYAKILDDMGLGIYTARILRILTGSPLPFQALKRFVLLNLFIGLTVSIMGLFTWYVLVPLIIWAILSIYIMILMYSRT